MTLSKEMEVKGKKGGGGGKARTPVEEPNTLQANTIARIVDLLCEGEISGPANTTWEESTYFNETPVKSGSTTNFSGVEIEARTGTANQEYLRGFDKVENEVSVSTKIEYATPITRTISDSDVDDVKITLSVPTLMKQENDGDLRKTKVTYEITVTPDNGAGAETGVGINETTSGVIEGKTTTEYRKQHTITNISQYGNAPWVIKVYRRTADSTSAKLINDLHWYSYTKIKNIKIRYMDRSVIGVTINAKEFGDNVPYRAYKIKGRKIKYPQNYNPTARTYTGTWDGTFVTGYTNNPAWVVYDLLTNDRFGIGLSEDQVDKWSLYTIAVYCDSTITYTEKTRQSDGTYTSTQQTEPRFTFNGVIADRAEALAVVNHLCSVFRGFPIWSTGQVSFVQDSPSEISRVATNANVIDGVFEYSGAPKTLRHTAVKVSWNNPEYFGRLDTLIVEDEDGIESYGYNPIDITAFGCTSKSEAIRRAKYSLYTDINQTEGVTFQGGIEWADCIPGEIVAIQDSNYSDTVNSGRVVSGTTTSIDIDRTITIESGVTYTLYCQSRYFDTGEAAYKDIIERTLTNSVGDATTLTWDDATDEAPLKDAVWVLSSSSVATRNFLVIGLAEVEAGLYQVNGVLYDGDKYNVVEDGLVLEVEPTTALETGALDPPSNIDIQPYSYTESDQGVRKYGMVISWTASPDPRTQVYELRYKRNDGGWVIFPDKTSQLSFDWRDVEAGTYDISVRAVSITATSTWVTYSDYVMVSAVSGPAAPTGLQVKGGGTTFSGRDIQIEWTGSAGADYTAGNIGGDANVGTSNVKNYKVEVYTTGDSLLRTHFTESKNELEYIYTYEMNKEDNSGTPSRSIKFKVYTNDVYDTLSTAATLTASNPIPSMASSTPTVEAKYGYLKVTWTTVADNDMDYYKVYYGTSNPPGTLAGTVIHPDNIFEIHGLDFGTNYYVQIEPYDKFGAGTKSRIPTPTSPLEIPGVNVDAELSNSITASDSVGNNVNTLAKLYDRNYSSNGVAYTGHDSTTWIRYSYAIENYFDRIGIWTSGVSNVYFRITDVNDTNDQWFKYVSGTTLTAASNQADAIANPWTLAAGKNVISLPNNVTGYNVRVYIKTSTTVFEFIPSRIIISELAAIETLSAIAADIGTIQAGNLQSDNYSSTTGFNIDLDAKRIYLHGYNSPSLYYDDATDTLNINAKVTFKSGSSGISNISDAGSLASQDNVDWDTEVTGAGKPEDNATDNSDWEHPDDVTKIDGGDLYVGSTITLNEGGRAVFGDQNVIIDTSGNHGSVVVSEDGGPSTNSYCELSDGDINFQYWDGATHTQYKSLTRIEAGTATNGEVVNLPGIFKSQPYVMISPNQMEVYRSNYSTQTQKIRYTVDNLVEYTTNKWRFIAKAALELGAGSTGTVLVGTNNSLSSITDLYGPQVALPANTRKFSATANITCYWNGDNYSVPICTGTGKDRVCSGNSYYYYIRKTTGVLYLQGYVSGSWTNLTSTTLTNITTVNGIVLNVPTQTADITYYRLYWDHTSTGSKIRFSGNPTSASRTIVNNVSYSSDQVGATVLAGGTLNWIAIGQ